MASSQEKLNDGIDKVCALNEAGVLDESLADEAFAKVKVGIVQCRKNSEALDSQSKERAQQVLLFLVRRSLKKKAAKGQICECLKILLARPSWLCTAQKDTELLSMFKQAFADNTEIMSMLESRIVTVLGDDKSVSSESSSTKPMGIQEQLNYGFQIMQSFDWEFPRDPLGEKIDEATDGFKHFFDAVTLLTTTGGKASVGGDVASVFTGFEEHWEGLLRFFISMYNCGFRVSYSARIKFVVVNLRNFSANFRSQSPWKELPWGSEPMPPEEAAEDAAKIAAEEEAREARLKLEHEDFAFALEMQIREEEQKAADERMRKKLTAQDSRFAQSLHDNELARLHPSSRSAAGGC